MSTAATQDCKGCAAPIGVHVKCWLDDEGPYHPTCFAKLIAKLIEAEQRD